MGLLSVDSSPITDSEKAQSLSVAIPILNQNQPQYLCIYDTGWYQQYSAELKPLADLPTAEVHAIVDNPPVSYRITDATRIDVYNSKSVLDSGTNINGSNTAGAFLVKKRQTDNAVDFSLRVLTDAQEESKRTVDINAYELLKLLSLKAYYESSFEDGERSADQEIVFPIPNQDFNIDIIIFHPHFRKEIKEGEDVIDEAGKESFQKQITDILIAFIEADENSAEIQTKLGLKDIFNRYKPIRENRMRSSLRRNREFGELRRYQTEDLQKLAGLFADRLLKEPKVRSVIINRLIKHDFAASIESDQLYPPDLIQEAADQRMGQLREGNTELLSQIATAKATRTQLIDDLAVLEQEIRDHESRVALIERRKKEMADIRDSLIKLEDELIQLKDKKSAIMQIKADIIAQITQLEKDFQVTRSNVEAMIAGYHQRLHVLTAEAAQLKKRNEQAFENAEHIADLDQSIAYSAIDSSGHVSEGWFFVGFAENGSVRLTKLDPINPSTYIFTFMDLEKVEMINQQACTLDNIHRASSLEELIYIINKIPEEQFKTVNAEGRESVYTKKQIVNSITSIAVAKKGLTSLTDHFELRSTVEKILQDTDPQLLTRIKEIPSTDSDETDLRTYYGLLDYFSILTKEGATINGFNAREVANRISGVCMRINRIKSLKQKNLGYPQASQQKIYNQEIIETQRSLNSITRGSVKDPINPRVATLLMLINIHGEDLVYEIFGTDIISRSQRDE